MSLFAIGDPHLSFGTDKPMNIFSGWDDYVPRLEKHWRALVSPEDTVVLPGDLSWAINLDEAEPDLRFLNDLPGRKILGKGNHDYWWSTVTKMEAFFADRGFDSLSLLYNNAVPVGPYAICGTRGWFFDDEGPEAAKILNREVGRLKLSLAAAEETGLEPLVFLHYPPITGDRECEPIMDVLRESGIRRCWYAHLHGNAITHAFRGEKDGIRFELVSADSLQFCPLLIERF